jgi:hypothetical protein
MLFLSLITAKSIAQSQKIASKKVTFFNLFLGGGVAGIVPTWAIYLKYFVV